MTSTQRPFFHLDDVKLDGKTLSLEDVRAVAQLHSQVNISDDVLVRMQKARDLVEEIAKGDSPVYGINTGFGALAEVPIPKDKIEVLQQNLVRSHAVGVGEPLPFPTARALMLLRANILAVGHSGCRPLVLVNLVTLLNAKVAPLVPHQGSVGASGDLAPLAHLALLLLGEGHALCLDDDDVNEGSVDHPKRITAKEALEKAGLKPVVLQAKEGLALINGTQAMSARGTLALLEAERLCRLADVVGALSLDALQGTVVAFDERIHQSRPHPGQLDSAQNLRSLLEGSEIMETHKDCGKVQDPYSLRCMPQVHGATRDALVYVRSVLEREINSGTDNPLVFLDGDYGHEGSAVLSGGNFHGQPIALALDFLSIAIAELASISERRVEQLVNPALSSGLPPFLAKDPGLNSGFMILQVTAASLINENKVLSHPASTDSIPSSANREDHVSMGMTAANKAAIVVRNVRRVLGIELICACQALDLRSIGKPKRILPGSALRPVYDMVRARIDFAEQDRVYIDDLAAVDALCQDTPQEDVLLAASDVMGPIL
ncbi:MAG: histidine ammonia-lyase [Deltaproteobacteria bacterium]|nr:histidine ammonia-lyase [Deltaproteobacteria bacterium]